MLVALIVLVVAAAIEGVSLAQAIRQVRAERSKEQLDLRTFLRRSDDPTVITVLFEDSAAITGLVIAFAGVGLTALTGSQVWDGLASLLIGLLLRGRRLRPHPHQHGAAHRAPGRPAAGARHRQAARGAAGGGRGGGPAHDAHRHRQGARVRAAGLRAVGDVGRHRAAPACGSTTRCARSSPTSTRCSWSRCRAATRSCAPGSAPATAPTCATSPRLKPSDPVRPHGAERVTARRRGPALAAKVAEPVGGGEVRRDDLEVAAVVGGQPPADGLGREAGGWRTSPRSDRPAASTRATSPKTSTGRTR